MPPAEGHAADLSRNQASATAIHHSPGHSSLTGASPCHSNTLRLHCSQENIRHLGLKSKAPCGMVPACLASPNSQHPNAHCELSFPCTLPYALFPEHILLSLTSVPLLILFPLPECHSLPSLPFGELSFQVPIQMASLLERLPRPLPGGQTSALRPVCSHARYHLVSLWHWVVCLRVSLHVDWAHTAHVCCQFSTPPSQLNTHAQPRGKCR